MSQINKLEPDKVIDSVSILRKRINSGHMVLGF